MFHEDPRELQRRGSAAKLKKQAPEERALISQKAAMTRWYKPVANDVERVNAHLRELAAAAQRAREQGNDDRLIRAITAMGAFERMRLWLSKEAGRPGGPALDMEQGQESAKRYEEGAKKAKEEDETVVE